MADFPEAFRAHFAGHNRRVILLAAMSIILTAVGWIGLYFALQLGLLLVLTVSRGIDARQPASFLALFVLSAALFTLVIAITQQFSPHKRLADRKPAWEVVLDFLLALPRATLSILGTLSAYQFLDARELDLAWRLTSRISREKRLPFQAVAQEIPSEKDRARIVTALQLVELVEMRGRDGDFYLALRGEAAERLCGERLRFRLPE